MLKAEAFDRSLHDLMIHEFKGFDPSADTSIVDEAVSATSVQKGSPDKPRTMAACSFELGAFNPGVWNDPSYIGRNNCYNYGIQPSHQHVCSARSRHRGPSDRDGLPECYRLGNLRRSSSSIHLFSRFGKTAMAYGTRRSVRLRLSLVPVRAKRFVKWSR